MVQVEVDVLIGVEFIFLVFSLRAVFPGVRVLWVGGDAWHPW